MAGIADAVLESEVRLANGTTAGFGWRAARSALESAVAGGVSTAGAEGTRLAIRQFSTPAEVESNLPSAVALGTKGVLDATEVLPGFDAETPARAMVKAEAKLASVVDVPPATVV